MYGTRKCMVHSTTRSFGSPLRYIQGPGEFKRLPEYTSSYGKAEILIDGFLFDSLSETLKKVYENSNADFKAVSFTGECCEEEIKRICKAAAQDKAGLVVGVGGGKTLDTAKLCADTLQIPMMIVPTSASTDAPVSDIAVLYTQNGEYVGSRKIAHSAELVLVDSEIIIKAPKRLFIAGMGDALATYLEASACEKSDSPNYIGENRRCRAGMAIAKECQDILFSDGKKALLSLENGVITEAFENVIEANTLMSGLGFLNTGLATAHGIHSGLTMIPSAHKYLHGEKVAFGIVCQMVLENVSEDTVDQMMKFMVEIGLPVTLEDLNVEPTEENIRTIARKTVEGPLVHHEPFVITEAIVYDAILAADALGRRYKGK